jgi:predicted extracellular nuclease
MTPFAFAVTAIAPAQTAFAQSSTLAQWTFEGDVITPASGSGTASLVGGTTATFATGFPPSGRGWNTTGYPAQGTGSKTRGAQFTVSTLNFSNIVFSFDQRHSNTAANTVVVQYSTDGVNFTDAQTFIATAGDTFFSRTVDLSAIAAVNNVPALTLRVVSAFAGSGSVYVAANPGSSYAGGTMRFDNVTFAGVASPTDLPPTVTGTTPPNGATGVSTTGDLTINFSEPVTTAGNWFTISCAITGVRNVVDTVVAGGPASFTINPNADFAFGETCSVTVFAANVTDQDGTPDTMTADAAFSFTLAAPACTTGTVTPIYSVQGATDTSPFSGTVQTVQGVVVGDYEGASPNLRGFYLQEATGDGVPETSDGLFVFNFNNNSVTLGSLVRVTGQVQEFQGQTQISSVSALEQCSAGANVTPVDVTLPFPSADFPERFEGMLVRFPQTLFVTEHFQLGRFGQIVASSSDRLRQPTNVVAPGAPAQALQAQNNLNKIIVDDALNAQNPDPIVFGRAGNPLSAANTLRGGDTFSNTVGVFTFGWAGNAASGNAYRLRPINALGGGVPAFVASNPRPATPENVGGNIKVAGINLLNYFNTFGATACTNGVGGSATECRGADNAAEFDRQTPKTVAGIIGTGADVIGVNEIENDGYGPTSAIADLTSRLNAATAPGTYAFVDVDARTGQVNALGNDAIKVGFIYKPAKVTLAGNTAALNTGAFGQYNILSGTIQRNRPALAQTFQQNDNGDALTVVVNHLKSKGSGCEDNISPVGPDPDAGDGQGNCNLTRKAAAEQLAQWLATNPAGIADPDVLIIGDLNSYAQEDPITALENAGYINLIEQRLGANAYSFVFDGQWGYLDHALASPSLAAKVTGVTEWHINADEPSVLDYNTNFKSAGQQTSLFAPDAFRAADHDPVIIGIGSNTAPLLSAISTYNTGLGANGAEIVSARGNRALVTNAGDGSIDILDITDILSPTLVQRIKMPELAGLNSVAIHPTKDFFLAVVGTSKPAAAPVNGKVLAFRLSDGALLAQADVGIQPDSIGISPDGNTALVANEAEAPAQNDNGGPGSISRIDLSAFDPATSTSLTVVQIALPSFAGQPGFSTGRTDDIGRIAIDNTPATLEPESVTFAPDNTFALITLQENTGVVKLNLSDNSIVAFGLGQTSHLADLTVDGVYNPVQPLTAFREPDGVAVIDIAGVRYFVTADEGDTRNSAGSNGVRGSRTVSVFDATTGALVADTGNQLDAISALFGRYPDGRSNRGGSEPEVLDATVFAGKVIVAVGLERANAVALVDVTTPAAPRAFALIPSGLAPEGVKLFERDGALFVFSANEADGTLTVARVPAGDALFTQTYVQDRALTLHNLFVIEPDASDRITVTIQLNDPTKGALSTGTAGGATSSFDPASGLYSVSGNVSDVNAVLAGIVFAPAAGSAVPVSLAVTATDGVNPAATGVVTLNGVATVVAGVLPADALGNEGSTLSTTGAFIGQGVVITLTAGPGTLIDNGNGAWSWSLATNDNLSPTVVTVQAWDALGATATVTFTTSAANVAPTATFVAPASVNEGAAFSLTLVNPFDPSSVDTAAGFTYVFDCGAGYGAPASSNTANCTATDGPATLTVKGKIIDKDAGATEYTSTISVNNVAPTATFVAPAAVNEGSVFTLTLVNPFDPSGVDTAAGFTHAFNCGAGAGPFSASNTASCTVATGFAGFLSVSGSIRDKDGGTTTYVASVQVASSRDAKIAVRNALAGLLPTGDRRNDDRIRKAIERIDDSLRANLWNGGSRLTRQGNRVFDLERQAVQELQKVTGVNAVVAGAISELVRIDRALAQVAIADAIAAGGDARDIAKAQQSLADGDAQAARPDPDKAIQEYKKAWESAIKAIR